MLQLQSTLSREEIERRLMDEATRRGFGLIAIHDLREIMERKGIPLAMECRVYEVCNPHQAKTVLEAEGAMAAMLPCRIALYGRPGSYTLASMPPTEMLQYVSSAAIRPVAEEVEAGIIAIMEHAVGAAQAA